MDGNKNFVITVARQYGSGGREIGLRLGEILGVCPKCGRNVIRGKSAYGCIGYTEGCDFRIGLAICKKTIPIMEIRRLLATGSTVKLSGFISKTGKTFRGKLVIKDGAVVFSFD